MQIYIGAEAEIVMDSVWKGNVEKDPELNLGK
jgi:hypothetical protein